MATLEIIFKGMDGVGPVINNINTEFNTLQETTSKAKESGSGFFSGMLQTATGFLAANVVGAITGQVKDFIGSSISDARESNLIFAQTEAAIKSTGNAAGVTAQQVRDMAGDLSAAAGKSLFDDDDIQKGDNLLLTFTNIKETLPQATSVMVDMATAMHTDAAGGAIQLGKALNDPEKGITALTRVGVTFTDQQKEQIKVLQESGDMAGAQTIILNELNKEFGGSAAAAAKADGGMAQFKAQIGDLSKQIGGALIPVINQLVGFAITELMPMLQTAADWFSKKLPVAIDYITTTVIPALTGAWKTIEPAVSQVITVVQSVIQSFTKGGETSDGLASRVKDLSNIWANLQPVIANVTNAIGSVVNAVFGQIQTFLRAHGADIQATMQDAWTKIMTIIKLGIELYNSIVPPVLRFIAGFITAHGKEIQAILASTWNSIKATIDVVLTLIEGVIRVALDLIHGNWSQAWEDLKTMSARIVLDLWTILKGGIDNIVTIFGGMWTKIKDAAGTFITVTIPGLAASIIDGLVTGIENGGSAIANAVWRMVKDAVNSAISSLTGGGSGPSTNSVASPRISGPVNQGISSSSNNTSLKANVTIHSAPDQNPYQIAQVAVNQLNRNLTLRRA